MLVAAQVPQENRHRNKPADANELAEISSRGRAIAEYDKVAWHASDEVQALKPSESAIAMYIGRQTPEGWVVAFGKLNDAKDAFLIAYEAHPAETVIHPRIVVNTPALEDKSEWLNEARGRYSA